MSVVHPRGNAVIAGNLTPMIDMIFLLIVFFVLVSRIVDRERVELKLPQPQHAATQQLGEEHRVVLNVLPATGGRVQGYRVGGAGFGVERADLIAMTLHIADLFRKSPTVNLHIRADRSTSYEHVEVVMQAVSTAAKAAGAAAARVSLVVMQEHER